MAARDGYGGGTPQHRQDRADATRMKPPRPMVAITMICQCSAAAIAEPASGLDLRTAARADRRECPTAFATETGTLAIICLAPGTLHGGANALSLRCSRRPSTRSR